MNKPPGIVLVFVPIELVAPATLGAIRLAGVLFAGLGAAVVVLAVAPLIGRGRALAAGALVLLAGASTSVQGWELNTEHVLYLVGVVPIVLALRPPGDRVEVRLAAACGVLGGLAVLVKPVAVLLALAVLPALLVPGPAVAAERIRRLAAFAAGGAVPVVLCLLVFALVGAADDLVSQVVAYNVRYAQLGTQATVLPPDLPAIGRLVLGACAVLAVRIAVRRGRDLGWTVLLWLLMALAGADLGRRNFPHYFAPVVVPGAVALALPLTRNGRRPAEVAAGVLLAAVLVVVPFGSEIGRRIGVSGTEVVRQSYGGEADLWAPGYAIGQELRRLARPGDRVHSAGSEAIYAWAARLPPATRYDYDFASAIIPDQYRREVSRLCSDPPRFLVLPVSAPPVPPADCLMRRPYRKVAGFGPVSAYALP